MNILHINTYPTGGAFTGAYRLHLALIKSGVSSKMLVKYKPENSTLDKVFFYNTIKRKPNLFNRVSTKLGFPITEEQKKWCYTKGLKGKYEIISFPFSDYDITKSQEYEEADIIHIHWVAGYLDYNSFFKKCNKPIVITLRDMNPILGIFHYEDDKLSNSLSFGKLENIISESKIQYVKRNQSTINIVGISDWITKKSIQNEIFKNLPHKTILNCININDYLVLEKVEARKKLNISNDSIVFSFVSDGTSNKRKGLDLLLAAFNEMPNVENFILITAGQGGALKFPLHIIHRHIGSCSQSELNIVYTASDAFIFPSREEALGNVMLEAMACGTPVIGTPIGGLLDVIKPGFNGIFSKDVSVEGLKEAILEFIKIKDQFDSKAIRKFIEDNFNEELIAGKYIELYNSILKNK